MLGPQSKYLEQVRRLNVNRSGDRRAPHKPLLLLIAISRLLRGEKQLSFSTVTGSLDPLLRTYAPPVKSRHQPELPYWHLQGDGLWAVTGGDRLPLQKGGFPRMDGLRRSSGHLDSGFARALLHDRVFLDTVVAILLEDHFPESLHDDILEAVGLDVPAAISIAEETLSANYRRRRDPDFRREVLRAYEHRCAVTGFRAALGGQYFGCEAAHVRWHAQNGPDTIDNGFAADPTIHKLFDAGAWSLTDDRRILVSAEFTGSGDLVNLVRKLHGQPLRQPLPGQPEISVDHIRWHREPQRGGVFRHPPL